MLTPLAVIRKLGLRHFYSITRNSLEIEIYKETECLRNYFITESIKADENEKVQANKCSFSAILSVKKKLGPCLGCIKTTCRQRFNLKLHSTHLYPIFVNFCVKNSLFQTLPQDGTISVFCLDCSTLEQTGAKCLMRVFTQIENVRMGHFYRHTDFMTFILQTKLKLCAKITV